MFHLYITVILGEALAVKWIQISIRTLFIISQILKPNFFLCVPSPSFLRYWWNKPTRGWGPAGALRGQVPQCEQQVDRTKNNGKWWDSCLCQLKFMDSIFSCVHRVLLCSSTLQELRCSKGISHLWVTEKACTRGKLSLVEKRQSVIPPFVSAGAGKVPGVHRSTGGVASDPPPVLLGTDVGLLLRVKVGRGVPVCWPALQREQMVTGDPRLNISLKYYHYFPHVKMMFYW